MLRDFLISFFHFVGKVEIFFYWWRRENALIVFCDVKLLCHLLIKTNHMVNQTKIIQDQFMLE
jgi:hypothetical protein